MNRGERDLARALSRSLTRANQANIYNGTAISGGGSRVSVYVPGLNKQISAIALGNIPAGPCQVYRTSSGWVVKSEVSSEVRREQGSDRRNREVVRTGTTGNIKILFSRVINEPVPDGQTPRREYWIGGDRKDPIKVYEDPPTVRTPVYFHNTGKKEENWLLCRAWQVEHNFYFYYLTQESERTEVLSFPVEEYIYYVLNPGGHAGPRVPETQQSGETANFYGGYGGNGCFMLFVNPIQEYTHTYSQSGEDSYITSTVVWTFFGGGAYTSISGSGTHFVDQSSRTSPGTSEGERSINSQFAILIVTPNGINDESISSRLAYHYFSAHSGQTQNSSTQVSCDKTISQLGKYRRSSSSVESYSGGVQEQNVSSHHADSQYAFYYPNKSIASTSYTESTRINTSSTNKQGIEYRYRGGNLANDRSFNYKVELLSSTTDLIAGVETDEDGFLVDGLGQRTEISQSVKLKGYGGFPEEVLSDAPEALGLSRAEPVYLIIRNNRTTDDNSGLFWEYEGDYPSMNWDGSEFVIRLLLTKRRQINWAGCIGVPKNPGKVGEETEFHPVVYQKENLGSIASILYETVTPNYTETSNVPGYPTYTSSFSQIKDYDNKVTNFHSPNSPRIDEQNYWNWQGKYLINSSFTNLVLESDQMLWVEAIEFTRSAGMGGTRLKRNTKPIEAYSLKCEQNIRIDQVSAWLP